MKYPKYLVEVDFAGHDDHGGGWWPTRPLWVARTRDPFVLAKIKLTGDKISTATWPPVFDGDRRALADKLAHALLRDFDLCPGDLTAPELAGGIIEPPDFIHMIRPDSSAEYILDPHGPLLWRVRLTRRLDTAGAEWVQGFGRPPRFPDDLRRVTKFLTAFE